MHIEKKCTNLLQCKLGSIHAELLPGTIKSKRLLIGFNLNLNTILTYKQFF